MPDTSTWVEIEATVTECRFQFARLNTLSLGLQTGEKFRISFNYSVGGRLYTDTFQSPIALAQGTRFPVSYNPLQPEQNSRTSGHGSRPLPNPLIGVGVAGSIALLLLYLAAARGCS